MSQQEPIRLLLTPISDAVTKFKKYIQRSKNGKTSKFESIKYSKCNKIVKKTIILRIKGDQNKPKNRSPKRSIKKLFLKLLMLIEVKTNTSIKIFQNKEDGI